MNSFNDTANFNNLLLQSLMGNLQIRPPNYNNNPQSLEDLLLDAANRSDSDDGDDNDNKTHLAKEESKLEKQIIRQILAGNTHSLKPNSGQAVTIGEHHICVGFHDEKDSDYRVWEWHGHVMLFDEENGYSPEYIYGNYFERRIQGKVEKDDEDDDDEKEEKVGKLGLRELIDGGDSSGGRILHRNVNASSQSYSEAMNDHLELEKEDPMDCFQHFHFGILYLALEKYDEADKQFEICERLAPKLPPNKGYFGDDEDM